MSSVVAQSQEKGTGTTEADAKPDVIVCDEAQIPRQFLPLYVDELEWGSCSQTISPSTVPKPALIKGAPGYKGVIGPIDLHSGDVARPCPCCRRYVSTSPGGSRGAPPRVVSPDRHEQDADDDLSLFGSLTRGTEYDVKETLAEGWVHKKGTGKDWLGSTAWKARWAVLCIASVPGYDVDVPLLLIYWYNSAPIPSNVIILDSTVVMPVDKFETTEKIVKWNTYCFEVVHLAGEDKNDKTTRTFTVPEKERNEWVYVINKALILYERRSVQERIKKARSPPSSPIPNRRFNKEPPRHYAQLPPTSPVRSRDARSPSPIKHRTGHNGGIRPGEERFILFPDI